MSGATYEMQRGPEEERNIPMRICLTRSEFDTLEELAIQSKLMASSTEGDVAEVIEQILSTVVQDERGFLALIREELEP